MFKGFKDFLMRGNVIDLAVAVVMGTAFTAVVTAVTKGIINPLLAVMGKTNELGLGIQLVAGKPPPSSRSGRSSPRSSTS